MAALRYGLMSAMVLVFLASRMPAGDEEKISLAGDWAVTAMSKDGNAAPAQLLENVFLRATGTTIVPVAKKDQKEDERSKLEYKIVGAKEIDLYEKIRIAQKGEDKETESVSIRRGIYELTGDTLKLCWSEGSLAKKDANGKLEANDKVPARPTAFNGGPGLFNAVLKRQPK